MSFLRSSLSSFLLSLFSRENHVTENKKVLKMSKQNVLQRDHILSTTGNCYNLPGMYVKMK